MTKTLLIASCGLLALLIGAKIFEEDVKPAPSIFEPKCIEDQKSSCGHAEIFMRGVRKKARKVLA